MPNLKDARANNLEDFIKEHESDPVGDLDKLDAVIKKTHKKGGQDKPDHPARSQSD